MSPDYVKLDSPDEHGNTHQCFSGPFCWLYGRMVHDKFFIPSSDLYGNKIVDIIREWESIEPRKAGLETRIAYAKLLVRDNVIGYGKLVDNILSDVRLVKFIGSGGLNLFTLHALTLDLHYRFSENIPDKRIEVRIIGSTASGSYVVEEA